MTTIFLSIRSLYFQRKRYLFIALAMLLGYVLITLVAGVAYGSLESVKIKAGRYFSGNTSITGYTYARANIANPRQIIDSLLSSPLPIRTIASRTSYNNNDATLFFNGETIRQRKLIGVDFAMEGPEFAGLTFTKGSWATLASETGSNSILISKSAANILGCAVGDDLMLYLTTDTGQYNTARLIVRGIFNETSLFGYVAYMRRVDLNRLLLRNSDAATDIAVYANEGINVERFTENVRQELAKNYKVFPRLNSREERDKELAKGLNVEETIAVLSQNAQLAQIKQFIDALLVITYFTLAIFIVIVMVGILNTYRVLIYERRKEIGTLRALGMGRGQVRLFFLIEAAFLSLISSFIGLIVGFLMLWLLTQLDLTFIPAAGMFLEGGHLRFSLDPRIAGANIAIMLCATVLAVWGPSGRASHVEPAEAMRSA